VNIVQLPIAGITLKDTSGKAASTGSLDGEVDFSSLLNGILSEAGGEGQSENPALTHVIERILLALNSNESDKGALKAEISGLEDLLGRLGEKLLELIAKATEDGSAAIDKEGLLSALDDFVADLAGEEVDPGVKKTLVNLFAGAKEVVSGRELEEGDLLSGLQEKIKAKLHILRSEPGQGLSEDEKVLLRFKLVSNLLGAARPNVDVAGVAAGQAANAVKSGTGAAGQPQLINHPLSEIPGISVRSEHSPVFKGEPVPGGGSMASKEPGSRVVSERPISISGTGEGDVEAEASVVKQQAGVSTAHQETLASSSRSSSGEKPTAPQSHATALDGAKHQEAGIRNAEINIPKDPQGQPLRAVSDSPGLGREALDAAQGKRTQSTAEGAFSSLQSGEQDLDSSSGRPSDASSNGHLYNQAPEAKATFAHEVNRASQANFGQGSAKAASANHDFVNQVIEKFEILVKDGISEARVQLRPRHLGEIKIHLAIENGIMKAVLDASTHQAKEMLESNLTALKQSLESQGIQVKEFSVSVGQQRENQEHNNNRFGRGRHAGLRNTGVNPGQIQAQEVRSMQYLGGDKVVNYLA